MCLSSLQASRPQVYLQPGHLHVGDTPTLVTTVLGSCVAVTLFDARTRFAGICHALLAYPPDCQPDARHRHGPFTYVNDALEEMTRRFFERGIAPGFIEVKLFGGAHTLAQARGLDPQQSVGHANIQCSRTWLERAGLSPRQWHVGGTSGRKILFDTATGTVLLKQLPSPGARPPRASGLPHDQGPHRR